MIPQLKSIFNQNQLTQLINLITQRVNALIAGKENVSNKQNSLAADVTNTKYPTVTAVNAGLSATTLNQVLTNGNSSVLDASIGVLGLYDVPVGDYGFISISDGDFELTNASGAIASLDTNLITGTKTFTFPNKNGTFAMLDDVTTAEAAANSYTDTEVATKQDKFDYSGSAIGTSLVTINDKKGGVARFTRVIPPRDFRVLTISSNLILSTSKIIPVLVYSGAGFPVILSQSVTANNVEFIVANLDVDGSGGLDTDATLSIQYQIVE
jgi:hypothetical protein